MFRYIVGQEKKMMIYTDSPCYDWLLWVGCAGNPCIYGYLNVMRRLPRYRVDDSFFSLYGPNFIRVIPKCSHITPQYRTSQRYESGDD